MWDEFLQRFREESRPHYYELKAAIMNYKQKGTSWQLILPKLKKLWDEITNFEKFSICDCEKIVTKLTKQREEEKLFSISLWTRQHCFWNNSFLDFFEKTQYRMLIRPILK